MRKTIQIIFITIFVLLLITMCFVGCNKKENKNLPKTTYDKVQFAFNGVESSLKNAKSSSKSNTQLTANNDSNLSLLSDSNVSIINLLSFSTSNSALDTIDNIYTSDDNKGDVIDELKYNEPPMIQFQCVKAAIEKIGDSYSFGTKYYYDITGSIYVNDDFSEKMSEDNQYKWDYVFRLALEINIDDNDLITVDVSFDINLRQGEKTMSTTWYVGMILDYDMTNLTPNYTLNMITDEDELNLISRQCYYIENDYVEVKDNKIIEWRKFGLETDRRILKDSNHQTFDSYIDEGINYDVGHAKWYKNSNLRKITSHTSEKDRIIANAYFNYGMNSTDINSNEFINKSGTENNVIQSIYNDMTQIFREDLVYDFVTDEQDSHKNSNAAGIRFHTEGVINGYACTNQNRDITFTDLFSESGNAWIGNGYIVIYYIDENSGDLDSESDLSKFKIFVSYNNETFEPSMSDRVDSIFKGVNVESRDYPVTLTLALNSNEQVRGTLNFFFRYINNSSSEEDNVIYSLGVERDNQIADARWLSIVDDITIKDIFLENHTHREYNERTGGIDTVGNYKFVYLNSKGQKISDVPLSDIVFGVKDSVESATAEYAFDKPYENEKISDLWYSVNSLYGFYIISSRVEGLSVVAMSKNTDLDQERNQFKFFITVKSDSAGDPIPLADAVRNRWPTKPIKWDGIEDDLPYVNPSQNRYEGEPYKYDFDFNYEYDFDEHGDIFLKPSTSVSMSVRLTESEAETYLSKIENEYGYLYNGIYDGKKEYIKAKRLLRFGYNNGVLDITIYKHDEKMVPDIQVNNPELDYDEAGYVISDLNLVAGQSLSDPNVMIEYFLENGNSVNHLRDPGTYNITVLIRYSGDSNWFDRRVTSVITIKSQT